MANSVPIAATYGGMLEVSSSWAAGISALVLDLPSPRALTSTNMTDRPDHLESRVAPPTIPRSQACYWTSSWQRQEGAALEEIRAGEVVRFSSSREAIQWLLADDDDSTDPAGSRSDGECRS